MECAELRVLAFIRHAQSLAVAGGKLLGNDLRFSLILPIVFHVLELSIDEFTM